MKQISIKKKPDHLYRKGVGIMLVNEQKKIFVGKRIDNNSNAWQMPQGGIDDGENVLFGFEFPEGDINGDTSFSLSFKLVQHPGVFERTFPISLASFSNFSIVLLSIPPHLKIK